MSRRWSEKEKASVEAVEGGESDEEGLKVSVLRKGT